MAGDEVERRQRRKVGIIGKTMMLPFTIAGIVLLSLLCSIAIEWFGIYMEWWSLPGAEHAQATMQSELGWLDSNFTRSLILSDPMQFVTNILSLVYEWVFEKPGITSWLSDNAESGGLAGTLHVYLSAAVYVTLMTLARCLILVLTSPLFAMAALVAFVDGLVKRDVRRFGAGRESAFVYHHAKRMVLPIFITGWLIYLSIPFSIHPDLFLVPCAALFGVLINIATASFKKYL